VKTVKPVAADGAVEDLARTHGQSLVAFAYVLSGDPDDAQDIVQAVFGRLLRLERFEASDPVAYARRAITNEFVERRRRSARWLRVVRLSRADLRNVESPETTVAERDVLLRAFGVLSPRERAVVVLRYYEGWDDDAIASTLGCAHGTVRSLLSRAMTKLRTSLGSDESNDRGRSR
jgi:RNA polymerase sigma factor (sigma-70 family)